MDNYRFYFEKYNDLCRMGGIYISGNCPHEAVAYINEELIDEDAEGFFVSLNVEGEGFNGLCLRTPDQFYVEDLAEVFDQHNNKFLSDAEIFNTWNIEVAGYAGVYE